MLEDHEDKSKGKAWERHRRSWGLDWDFGKRGLGTSDRKMIFGEKVPFSSIPDRSEEVSPAGAWGKGA